jgi:hypothetical protein
MSGFAGIAFASLLALQQAPPPEPLPPVPLAADHPLQPALATIRADDLRDYEAWLAADERKGRCAGEPGNDEAADWIAAKFEELGLAPLGDDGTYLQHFDFRVRGGKGGKMARTQNVVGLWEGSDPLLKEQVVVIGAHFDHVGTVESADAGRIGGPVGDDTIWNGADDNGSGTSTLIEVAQAFAESGLQPKRSLLFIAFSAEEQGLFGSAHWCREPTIPPERMVAMLNMDMVGRIPPPGKKIEMAATGSLENDLWPRLIELSRSAAPSLEFTLQSQSRPDSDHASFIDAGVPAVFIYTGEHADYHRPTDSADKITYDHMEQIGRFATALLWNAANCEEKLVFAKPKFEPRGRAKRLGVGVDGEVSAARMLELGFPKEQGGFEVKELDPEGVGSKAGLKPGDILLAIGGTPLSSDDVLVSLRRLVAGAPSGKDVPLLVLRGKEQVTLQARWK